MQQNKEKKYYAVLARRPTILLCPCIVFRIPRREKKDEGEKSEWVQKRRKIVTSIPHLCLYGHI